MLIEWPYQIEMIQSSSIDSNLWNRYKRIRSLKTLFFYLAQGQITIRFEYNYLNCDFFQSEYYSPSIYSFKEIFLSSFERFFPILKPNPNQFLRPLNQLPL